MQVKNLTKQDMTFMFTSPLSTPEVPLFGTVNIVAGWTVTIDKVIWDEISKQTKSVNVMVKEVIEIEGATMKDMNGKKYTPTRDVYMVESTTEVNLVQDLIKSYAIEVVDLDNLPVVYPPRQVMESFLKRNSEVFTEKEPLASLAAKVTAIKAELAALEDL